MNKKHAIVIGIAVLLLGAAFWLWSAETERNNAPATQITSDTIFFYGKECPHCKDVEKFISDNRLSDKVRFDSLEVWHNAANAEILSQKAELCGLSDDQIGVPFLFSSGKCYVGTPDVESFFKQAAEL